MYMHIKFYIMFKLGQTKNKLLVVLKTRQKLIALEERVGMET